MAVAADAARTPAAALRVPFKWYLPTVFLGVPLWWLLGVEAFIWPLFALPLTVALVGRRERLARPPVFGVWLLFLLWAGLSATQLPSLNRALAFGYRGSMYLAATVFLLYVLNASRRAFPTALAVNVMVGLAALVVAGGYLGLLLPDVRFGSLAQHLVPAEFRHTPFIADAVRVDFAGTAWVGHWQTRPTAPFRYPNEWGSTLALLVPFVLLALSEARTRLRQGLLSALLVAAVVPVLATVNRGVWLALMLALVYVAVRFAVAGRLRPVAYVGAFIAAAVAISVLSGFGAGAGSRVQADNSTHDRRVLYEEASRKAASSPLLGYGAPSHSAPDGLPAVGTHGQFFLVLVSQGIPGLLFFSAFFAYSAVKFRGLDPPLVFWAHVGLLIFFVESLYYELLPLQLILVMVLLGLAWREIRHAEAPAGSR